MGLTSVAVLLVLVGAGMLTAGLVALLGPWVLVAAGVVAVLAGLIPDWERA